MSDNKVKTKCDINEVQEKHEFVNNNHEIIEHKKLQMHHLFYNSMEKTKKKNLN